MAFKLRLPNLPSTATLKTIAVAAIVLALLYVLIMHILPAAVEDISLRHDPIRGMKPSPAAQRPSSQAVGDSSVATHVK